MTPPVISLRQARRLALVQAGLALPRVNGLPSRARGRGARARRAAHALLEHFGYLQLDSVAVTGARTHSIVLGSRLAGMEAPLGETLLRPGEPVFEYWGHEACWLPMSLYPAFEFRRREFRIHPWWGDLLGEHRALADALMRRVEEEGPLRSLDLEGERGRGGWGSDKLAQKVMEALWSAGELAVRERQNFQRYFDLTERVIPSEARETRMAPEAALDSLLLRALDGHGWATTGTLASTWRLKNKGPEIRDALARLVARGEVLACDLDTPKRRVSGWIKPDALERAERLRRFRVPRDEGVLLSPFDPVLWDRNRVSLLFGFEQRIEIYKPRDQRQYGYYCLPLLVGDRLAGRVDLKANTANGHLTVLACHYEANEGTAARAGMESALRRFAEFVDLELVDGPSGGAGWLDHVENLR